MQNHIFGDHAGDNTCVSSCLCIQTDNFTSAISVVGKVKFLSDLKGKQFVLLKIAAAPVEVLRMVRVLLKTVNMIHL